MNYVLLLKFAFSSFSVLLFSIGIEAQVVSIPDNAFEQALLDQGLDSDGLLNGQVQMLDLVGVTELDVSNAGIADLTGIEGFTDLENLYVYNNSLSSIDLSMNSSLILLHCFGNDLQSLDVTHNPALVDLSCSGNQLSSIDLSQNPQLQYLVLNSNPMESLDLSSNPMLIDLYCVLCDLTELELGNLVDLEKLSVKNNALSTIDLSHNTKLWYVLLDNNDLTELDPTDLPELYTLFAPGNQLSSLDLSGNPILQNLTMSNNNITEIDLSHNPALSQVRFTNNLLTVFDYSACPNMLRLSLNGNMISEMDFNPGYLAELNIADNLFETIDLESTSADKLFCDGNLLTSLDISHFFSFSSLNCSDNMLIELNLANGNNEDVNSLITTGNPGLACIQVDDATYSENNWSSIDPWTSFGENCLGQTSCDPDLNNDGYVGIEDFIQFNSAFGLGCVECPEDFNDDQVIDVQDFIILNSLYASPCGE